MFNSAIFFAFPMKSYDTSIRSESKRISRNQTKDRQHSWKRGEGEGRGSSARNYHTRQLPVYPWKVLACYPYPIYFSRTQNGHGHLQTTCGASAIPLQAANCKIVQGALAPLQSGENGRKTVLIEGGSKPLPDDGKKRDVSKPGMSP